MRKKNQAVRWPKSWSTSRSPPLAYFFAGYAVARGVTFMVGADQPAARSGYELVKFFFFFQLRRGDPGHHLRLRRRRGPGRPQLLATAVIGWKIDVLGVWPLHSLCAVWGGTAGGVFGTRAQAGLGGSIGRPS